MAVRRRFKPTERATFVPNTEVEFLNGSHWRPGVIVGPITVDTTGWQYVGIVNQGTTRTISDGAYVSGYPGGVRLRDTNDMPATDSGIAPETAPETTPASHGIEPHPEQAQLF